MSVRCRLVRADGSRWWIEELREVEDGFRVRAVPNGTGDHGPPGGEDGTSPSLQDAQLSRGDRVQWLEEDGEVLWSMKIPVGSGPAAQRGARERVKH